MPEMLAASVVVSVKLATIWPRFSIAGALNEPARPPLPRLSVLPGPIPTNPVAFTTAPLATVSVPERQPQNEPIASSLFTMSTELAPVTVTAEVPETSPMPVGAATVTVPPLAIVSMPGPPVTPVPTLKVPRLALPTVQLDPGPVTVTLGVPNALSISAPLWLMNVAPLLMVRDPGPKMPMPVTPAAFTVEPAPETIMLLATRKPRPLLGASSVAPLMTERVPPKTATPWLDPLTVSDPPLSVRPPLEQLHRMRSPPIVPILP